MALCGQNQQTTTSGPPREVLDAYLQMLKRAQGVADQPLHQYAGSLVAGLSPSQQAAIQNINNAQGITTPYINSAAEYYGAGAAPVSTNAAGIAAGAGSAANAAAANAGAEARSTANRAGEAATSTANNAGAAATGIAGEGAGTARTQAQQGIDLARTGATEGAARANAAAATDVASTLPTFQSGIAQYMNPFTNDVVGATQRLFANQNAQEDERLKGNIISQGAWGGDRAGVAQGIAAGQRALSQDSAIANLLNQGFQQGTSQYNTDKALQASLGQNRANLMASTALGSGNLLSSTGTATGGLGANTALSGASLGANTSLGAGQLGATTALGAGQLGANTALGAGNLEANTNLSAGNLGVNAAAQQLQADQLNRSNSMAAGQGIAGLGTQAQNAALSGAQAQMQAGGLEQAIAQAQLNVPYQQFLQQQQYPFQTTQWLANLISSVGSGAGGTSTTTLPGSSAGTLAGLGLGAYALLSDERVKEGIEHVGALKDGQKVYRYNYKGDPTTRIGILAQEVEKKHPEAVHETADGIKAVDYEKATEASARKATGGGIAGVPDIDLSFIPEGRMIRNGGISIPRAPSAGGGNGGGIADVMSSLEHFDRIRKLLGRRKGGLGIIGGADDDDDRVFVPGEAMRSTGGYVGDDRFGPGIIGGGGIVIPRLSARPVTPYVIPSRLTTDFASRAADDQGNSLLPSTTYIPKVAPWTKPKEEEKKKTDDGGSSRNRTDQGQGPNEGGGPDGGGQKRGGRVRRDEGGIISADDEGDDPEETYDVAGDGMDLDGIRAPMGAGIASSYLEAPRRRFQTLELRSDDRDPSVAAKPFEDYDHEGPEGAAVGIAPAPAGGRYASRYEPRMAAPADDAADDAETRKMSLLAAAAGLMGKRTLGEGLGAALSQGVTTYSTLRGKAKDRKERAAALADMMGYRAEGLRLKGVGAEDAAKRFGEQLQMKSKEIEQRGKHMETQAQTAADAVAERKRHNQAVESRVAETARAGNIDYIGTDPKAPDAENQGVYLNKKTGERTYGPVVNKPSVLGGASLSEEGINSIAEQYVAGDRSVLTGFGRNPALLASIRDRVMQIQKEQGMSGAAQAAAVADFQGHMAGARALGTMAAKMDSMALEAKQFAQNALRASEEMPRGKWMPINRALQFYQTNSGDPRIRAFGAYNNSLINAYSSVITRGSPTVESRMHAREMLSTADGPVAYKAVVDAMLKEIEGALASPELAAQRRRDAMVGQHAPAGGGGGAKSEGAGIPTFKNKAEMEASGLPSGSAFFDDQGKLRYVP